MQTILVTLLAVIWLSACTTTDEIIVDRKYSNMANYDEDLEECEGYAEQVATGRKAAKGAASGAAVGGLIGAIGGDSESTARGAGVGAVSGGAKGLNDGEQQELRVVKRCLRNRGYVLLN